MQISIRTERMKPRNRRYVLHASVHGTGGFTMVEMLVVMAVVAILSTVAMTSFAKVKELARVSRCIQEIRSMEREITAWTTEKGSYPPSLADINRDTQKDPWGFIYVYCPPTRKIGTDLINSDFDLYSKGPNGDSVDSIVDPLSEDDIFRGRDGGFVGVSSEW
jgi:general secretion pathway protein G